MRARRPVLLMSAVGLAACALGPDYQRPAPPAADALGAAGRADTTAATDIAGGAAQRLTPGLDIPHQWWALYQSPKMSALVEDALKHNPDVASARAALRQAHELYLSQRASFFPTVQGGLSAQRAKFASNALTAPTVAPTSFYDLYTAQLSMSYAPDFWGGTRRATEAAKAQEEGSRYQLEAARLTLSSNVVVTVIQEASLRGQIETTQHLLDLQHTLTDAVHRQRAAGSASNLDVLTQESLEAQTAQTLPGLNKQLGQTRDMLTALLGRLPSEEPSETFRLADLTLPTELPVSLPSKLVEQRPDVRQAEENLHVASAQVGVAIAGMFPQINLTADVGSSALELHDLFSPFTGFWDLGTSLTQTLFDAGALLHKRRAADAALDQAGAQYRSAVILAFQNVADSLRALRADAEALQASAKADQATRKTLDLARQQKALGSISQVAVLNAEQAYLQAELALVQAQGSRYSDTAGLFQALGGGWWNRPEEDHGG